MPRDTDIKKVEQILEKKWPRLGNGRLQNRDHIEKVTKGGFLRPSIFKRWKEEEEQKQEI